MSRTKGLNLPSVLIACNAPSIIGSVMDEIVFGSFGCDGICDECPVSGDASDSCDEDGEIAYGSSQEMPS